MPAPLESGWYAGDVLVTLDRRPTTSRASTRPTTASTAAPPQEYAGPFNHGLKGVHTITFWSVDKAGNVEDKDAPGHSLELKIDGVAADDHGQPRCRRPTASAGTTAR